MRLGDWLWSMIRGRLPPANPAEQKVARLAYAKFVEAQLIGLLPASKAGGVLAALQTALADDEARHDGNAIASIMAAETRLADLLTDGQIERYYWMVRDRLERVGAPSGIREHDAWAPASLKRPDAVATTPLAIARAAHTAALAAVGETAMTVATREAALTAAGADATDALRKLVEDARSAQVAAIAAADAAAKRVADLEAAPTPVATPAGNTNGSADAHPEPAAMPEAEGEPAATTESTAAGAVDEGDAAAVDAADHAAQEDSTPKGGETAEGTS